jgi:hypothetical protein
MELLFKNAVLFINQNIYFHNLEMGIGIRSCHYVWYAIFKQNICAGERKQFQKDFGVALMEVVPLLSPYTVQLIIPVAQQMIEHKSEDISVVWFDVYILCIGKVTPEYLKAKVPSN